MSSIQIKSSVTIEDLLQGVAQLEGKELDDFIQQVLSMSVRRKAGHLGERESELLELINESFPAPVQQRFRELDEKRRAETLTEAEQEELIRINSEMEMQNVQRLKYLSELALLRKVSLRSLMEQLGIPAFHA
ncbi:MAG: STAS/SEC14 domain-containing protein [Lewinellaceae bacterium]|nr:STAS/SEC14 domain-containing protein [Lewinellaceae bacterium]